ncbi:MAG: dTDP-glucose 4,6-dehydratase [bacterium TMED217]|nr:MAG: dTDP-glucose 4,6-dehydratase [bacterium TMED217]|tara:strand:+ start:839 stop:1882 length:1044 start_codon:yes stop_codon:yes gene_type:complete
MNKKTLFITGGCGFIGSNFIINQIQHTDNSIINLDKLTYAGNQDNLKDIASSSRYTFVNGDINTKNIVDDIFRDFHPNAVINFAAESHVDRSIDGPMEFVHTNIVGTANLLESSRRYYDSNQEDNFRFIHVSTDEVYGSLGDEGFFSEETPYSPTSPYSASKASSDHLVNAWHHTFNLPTIITNCSNNYGPYQFPEKLIPLMVMNCLEGKDLPVYGNGENVRDWLFVTDHCDAIYEVLLNGRIGHTYNIGGNNEIKNIEIVNSICEIMDKQRPLDNDKSYNDLIKFVQDRPGHDFRYAIDASKIKNELKWVPKENFQSGIQKTIKWYLSNRDWYEKIKYKQERLGVI